VKLSPHNAQLRSGGDFLTARGHARPILRGEVRPPGGSSCSRFDLSESPEVTRKQSYMRRIEADELALRVRPRDANRSQCADADGPFLPRVTDLGLLTRLRFRDRRAGTSGHQRDPLADQQVGPRAEGDPARDLRFRSPGARRRRYQRDPAPAGELRPVRPGSEMVENLDEETRTRIDELMDPDR
jgi:hypothetical protein